MQYGPVLFRMCGTSAITAVPARWLGVSHFRPVGAPAVNMGVQSGRGHSLSGAVAASRSPLACNGPGAGLLRHAAALCWESSDRGVVGAGCRHGGPSTSVCAWATVMPSRASTTRHW